MDRPPLKQPWQYTSDALPDMSAGEDLFYCRESLPVLIRSTEHHVYLARYRVYAKDVFVNSSQEPEWVLEGRDGYTMPVTVVDAWAPTPSWD